MTAIGRTVRPEDLRAMDRQPVFNVPAAVLVLAASMVAVHVLLSIVDIDTANQWLVALAFIPARYSEGGAGLPGGEIAVFTSWVTHAFVHGDLMHLGMNLAFFLAFGAACVRRIGTPLFLALMLASTVAGAATYLLFNGRAEVVMIGASGAISGLVGAVLRFLYPALAVGHEMRLSEAAMRVPRLSLKGMWREPEPRRAILAWLGLNFVLAVVLPAAGLSSPIAWEAHLGGFLVGLLMFAYFDRRHGEIDSIRPRGDPAADDAPPV